MNYELTIEVLSSNGQKVRKREKKAHPRTPLLRLCKSCVIIAVQPFYRCRQNVRKNITVTVSVRVSAMVRVSLVLLFLHYVSVMVSATVRVSLV